MSNDALQMATEEQRKADENVLRLVEEHKREKEVLLKKTLKLERDLYEKQQLEMEIEMKGNVEVMNHMGDDDDNDNDDWSIQKKMDRMDELLQEYKNEVEALKDSTNHLLASQLALQDNNDLEDLNNYERTVERLVNWYSTH